MAKKLSPPPLLRQISALSRKNFLQRRASYGSTFCEIMCPVIMMFLVSVLPMLIAGENAEPTILKVRP